MKPFMNIVFKSLFLIVFLSSTAFANTEIYRYRDADGSLHLTNRPVQPSSKSKKTKKNQEVGLSNNNLRLAGLGNDVKIYKFTDANGVVHLSDRPSNARSQLIYAGKNPLPMQAIPFSGSAGGKAKNPSNIGTYSSPFTPSNQKAQQYAALIDEAAQKAKVDPALVHAVVKAESAYNPDAVSPKGAVGLMQLMAGTAQRYGVTDRYDPVENLSAGTRYLRDLLDMFNDTTLAVAAYNAGENAVIRYGNQIPPYNETKGYVARVLSLYDSFRSAQ
jgi:hypothetical protein